MLQQVVQRIMRIVTLDTAVYEEIQNDQAANLEVALIVLVSSLLAAVGAAAGSEGFVGAFLIRLVAGILLNWLLWSFVTLFAGTRLFGGQGSFMGMARALGYASAPRALGILGIFGCLGGLVGVAGWALSLVAGFLATRETLELSTEKAIITVAIGWVLVLLVTILL